MGELFCLNGRVILPQWASCFASMGELFCLNGRASCFASMGEFFLPQWANEHNGFV